MRKYLRKLFSIVGINSIIELLSLAFAFISAFLSLFQGNKVSFVLTSVFAF